MIDHSIIIVNKYNINHKFDNLIFININYVIVKDHFLGIPISLSRHGIHVLF